MNSNSQQYLEDIRKIDNIKSTGMITSSKFNPQDSKVLEIK